MLLLLLACKTPVGSLDCTATASDTMTLGVSVDWTTDADATSYVEFGTDDHYPFSTPTVTGADVHLDLIGLPEDTDVHWRAVSTLPDGSTSECTGVTRNGALPDGMPELSVNIDKAGQDAAKFLIGAMFEGAGGTGAQVRLVAVNRAGDIVWYFLGDEDATGLDLHYARDGSGLFYNVYPGQMGGDNATIHKISLMGEELGEWSTPTAHHMFTELPDGTLAWQGIDVRSYTDPDSGETSDWVGDTIVETTKDGVNTTVLTTWDILTAHSNERSDGVSIYGGTDWTHGNNLRYLDDTDEYLLSLGHADDILFIDRETAAVNTIYGLDGLPASPQFDYQHDVNLLPDGNLLMFMTEPDTSGAVEYEVTDSGLEEVWRGPEGQRPLALGQARRLENGNTLVNAGAGNDIYEVTPDTEMVWRLSSDEAGTIFGQFQLLDSLYDGD